MRAASTDQPVAGPTRPGFGRWAPLVIAAAVFAVYANSWHGPFLFDDITAIVENTTIRRLGSALLSPPADTTVSGRPMLNATLALNYAVSGLLPWSYHAFNIALHAANAVLLFALIRRALSALRERADAHRVPAPGGSRDVTTMAFLSALLWALHPLQTESVTYVIQRAEALVTLWYLLTLYCFARSIPEAPRWQIASVVACALGMATKEVMATAPLVVLLFDRTFVAGTFRAAWQRRRIYYGSLVATWGLLAILMAGTQGRGGSAGFHADVSPWHYLLTQCEALGRYICLALWPQPLVFDYGISLVKDWTSVAIPGVTILAALTFTVWALVRRPVMGFVSAAFFVILAPTSSVVPIATQTIAEHRMYLPLALLVCGLVIPALFRFGRAAWIGGIALAIALGAGTWARNEAYRDDLTLWSDTAAKRPDNGRAYFGIAAALTNRARVDEAIAAYLTSIRLDPESVVAHTNLAALLRKTGRANEAREHYELALRLDPADPEAHNELGVLLAAAGDPAAALPHFEAALRAWPDRAAVHVNLGGALLQLQHTDDAVVHLTAALRKDPNNAEAHTNLGLVLLEAGRLADAETHFAAVLATAPDDIVAHNNLGYIALTQGRAADAVPHYARVARLNPQDPAAHVNLGHALVRATRVGEAVGEYEQAMRLDPRAPGIHAALAFALERLGRQVEARQAWRREIEIDPANRSARAALERLRE